MKKFYEKNELWFAIAWIVLYCMVMAPIRGSCGDDSPVMLAGLTLFAAGLLVGWLAADYWLDRFAG